MNKMDLTPYDKVEDVLQYDLFIDRKGQYYRVGKRNPSEYKKVSHEEWAAYFLDSLDANQKCDIPSGRLMNLAKINKKTSLLIQLYGFVYYSHDHHLYQPIIEKPDPYYFGKSATREQLDSLYIVMEMNKEKPLENPIFDENVSGIVACENRVDYLSDSIRNRYLSK